jgi:hypothetical protein
MEGRQKPAPPDRRSFSVRWGRPRAIPTPSRSVVVAYPWVAEKLVEHEPGVRAPLSDPAVGDHFPVGRQALALVEAAQLLLRQERARLRVDRLGPGDVARPRDVARLLGLLLGKVGGSQQLASVLLRRANIDQAEAWPAHHVVLDIGPQGPDLVIGAGNPVAAGRCRPGDLGGQRAAFQLPLLAPAVHQLDRPVTVVLEVPIGVGGEPVVVAAIEHDFGLVADPQPVHQRREGLRSHEVAPQGTPSAP